jgi:hypothetical protein
VGEDCRAWVLVDRLIGSSVPRFVGSSVPRLFGCSVIRLFGYSIRGTPPVRRRKRLRHFDSYSMKFRIRVGGIS